MSQPELKFEFDPPDFFQDNDRSPELPKRFNLLKFVAATGLLLAASATLVSLFYGDVTNGLVTVALAKKASPEPRQDAQLAIADAKALLAKLEESTRNLTERVASLETNLYRAKAAALGFRNPSIRPISLAAQPQQEFVFNYPIKGESHLELKILQITNESIVFEVTGTTPNSQAKAVKVAQPLKVGTSVELTQAIRMEGMPHVFMTVLEMPTKDTAIIAVGAKELAQS